VLRVGGGVVLGCELLGRIRHGTTEHLWLILEHPGGGGGAGSTALIPDGLYGITDANEPS